MPNRRRFLCNSPRTLEKLRLISRAYVANAPSSTAAPVPASSSCRPLAKALASRTLRNRSASRTRSHVSSRPRVLPERIMRTIASYPACWCAGVIASAASIVAVSEATAPVSRVITCCSRVSSCCARFFSFVIFFLLPPPRTYFSMLLIWLRTPISRRNLLILAGSNGPIAAARSGGGGVAAPASASASATWANASSGMLALSRSTNRVLSTTASCRPVILAPCMHRLFRPESDVTTSMELLNRRWNHIASRTIVSSAV